ADDRGGVGARDGDPGDDAGPGPEHEAARTGVLTWPTHQAGHAPDGPLRQLRARIAPRLMRGIVIAVFHCFAITAVLRVIYMDHGAGYLAVSIGCVLAGLALQLMVLRRRPAALDTRWTAGVLAAHAVLVYAPVIGYGEYWAGVPGFLGGSLLLLLPGAAGWPLFAVVVASVGVVRALHDGDVVDLALTCSSTIIVALTVWGLTRLSHLVTAVQQARTELAKMAVAQERLRVARDLHDLLGYSLSAISLKSELTRRLLARHPARAEEEITEILHISRQALADVRTVASGYRELSLDNEARSARSVLLAADVQVVVDLDYTDIPSRIGTAIATVLREAVTNVLRHSEATRCDILIRQDDARVTVDIVNDGVPAGDEDTPRRGRPEEPAGGRTGPDRSPGDGARPDAADGAGSQEAGPRNAQGGLPEDEDDPRVRYAAAGATVDGPVQAVRRHEGGPAGSGIGNLAARLRALGGTLTTHREPGRLFHLHAVVPLRRD
ncbi:MAG TPA: histidine kinase, partial [Pseudonocardiaceae bacterium]